MHRVSSPAPPAPVPQGLRGQAAANCYQLYLKSYNKYLNTLRFVTAHPAPSPASPAPVVAETQKYIPPHKRKEESKPTKTKAEISEARKAHKRARKLARKEEKFRAKFSQYSPGSKFFVDPSLNQLVPTNGKVRCSCGRICSTRRAFDQHVKDVKGGMHILNEYEVVANLSTSRPSKPANDQEDYFEISDAMADQLDGFVSFDLSEFMDESAEDESILLATQKQKEQQNSIKEDLFTTASKALESNDPVRIESTSSRLLSKVKDGSIPDRGPSFSFKEEDSEEEDEEEEEESPFAAIYRTLPPEAFASQSTLAWYLRQHQINNPPPQKPTAFGEANFEPTHARRESIFSRTGDDHLFSSDNDLSSQSPDRSDCESCDGTPDLCSKKIIKMNNKTV